MTLSLEEVGFIAELARLDLDEEEKMRFTRQLSAILDQFARLQTVDTEGLTPTPGAHPDEAASLRPDEPRPGLTLEELLRNAPQAEQGQFRVPPVFEP